MDIKLEVIVAAASQTSTAPSGFYEPSASALDADSSADGWLPGRSS